MKTSIVDPATVSRTARTERRRPWGRICYAPIGPRTELGTYMKEDAEKNSDEAFGRDRQLPALVLWCRNSTLAYASCTRTINRGHFSALAAAKHFRNGLDGSRRIMQSGAPMPTVESFSIIIVKRFVWRSMTLGKVAMTPSGTSAALRQSPSSRRAASRAALQ
jgi:hypothetical protein